MDSVDTTQQNRIPLEHRAVGDLPESPDRPRLINAVLLTLLSLVVILGGWFYLTNVKAGVETSGSEPAVAPNAPTSARATTSTSARLTTTSTSAAPAVAEPEGPVLSTTPPELLPEPARESPRIIRELARPVKAYQQRSMRSTVAFELLIGDEVTILRQLDGWYRVKSERGTAWVFGAFVKPHPDPLFAGFIARDGKTIRPEYLDGERVREPYLPGQYAFGYAKPQPDGRLLIYLHDGLVVYVDASKLRRVQ